MNIELAVLGKQRLMKMKQSTSTVAPSDPEICDEPGLRMDKPCLLPGSMSDMSDALTG